MTAHAEGFGGSLPWGTKPALLVIDMMQAYFTSGSPLCLPDRAVVEGCATLLDAARSRGVAVVHTRVAFGSDLADGGWFVRKIPALSLLAGADAALGRIEPEVAPRPGEAVVVKQYASAFFGTSLASTLTAARVDTVVVAGVSTSGCVRASATDALQHGFVPVVPADACGDRTPEVHAANLFDVDAKYADVTDVAHVVDWWDGIDGGAGFTP